MATAAELTGEEIAAVAESLSDPANLNVDTMAAIMHRIGPGLMALGQKVLVAIIIFLIGRKIISMIEKMLSRSMEHAGMDVGVTRFLRALTHLARRRLDKAHVRHPLVILGFLIRRLHRDDKHICRLRLRRKVQPTRGKRLRQRILQARLYNVDFSAAQLVDDLLLHIKPADLEARQRKRNCRRQTDVAAAHNFNLLHWEAPFPVDYRL